MFFFLLKKVIKNLPVVVLFILLIASQFIILSPHLKYGFSDVDWGFLFFYIKAKNTYPNIIENFLMTFDTWGVYAHQSYYIGFLYELFGLNYYYYQLSTNIFKIVATLIIYPVFYIISKRKLVALIGTFLFANSYSAIGTMYTVVTSSDYTALTSGLLFLWLYFYILSKNEKRWYFMIAILLLFHLSMFLSTERMNPLLLILIFLEIYLYVKTKIFALSRWLVLFSPTIVIILLRPEIAIGFLGSNGKVLIGEIFNGNVYLMLYPFVSLGSVLIPHNYWGYLGRVDITSFGSYIKYFVSGPLLILMVFSGIVGWSLFKKRYLFVKQMFLLLIVLGLTAYFLIQDSKVFDVSFTNSGILGGYILATGILSFYHFIKYQQGDRILSGIFFGIFSAFIFIIVTWLAADIQVIFTGAHRYLTVPSLFISLSLSCMLSGLVKRIWDDKGLSKLFISIPVLIIFFTIYIWIEQINDFFFHQLEQGFGAEDKNLMRSQLLTQTTELSTNMSSIFYFDFTEETKDPLLGYYYDNTLLGGFSTWMLWHPNINFSEGIKPYAFWNDIERLKAAYKGNDEEIEGLILDKKFYPIENFYAFKLKDKKVINIKKDLVDKLNSQY